jgi:hypothetical protein
VEEWGVGEIEMDVEKKAFSALNSGVEGMDAERKVLNSGI